MAPGSGRRGRIDLGRHNTDTAHGRKATVRGNPGGRPFPAATAAAKPSRGRPPRRQEHLATTGREKSASAPNPTTWEQRKLGELGCAQSGVGFPDAEQGGSEGVPFFKVSEIFFAKVGAAVMLNRKRLVNEPFLLDNNTMAFSMDTKALDPTFGQPLFERLDLTSLIQVGALPSYNASDVEDLDVLLPISMVEQQLIGQVFTNLDNLITLHQCVFSLPSCGIPILLVPSIRRESPSMHYRGE